MAIVLNLRAQFRDHQGGIKEIEVHRDGKLFFARSDAMLILYDLIGGRKLRGFYDSAGYDGALFDPYGATMIYQSDGRLHYWDLEKWRERMVVPGEINEYRDKSAHPAVGLTADGNNEGNIEFRKLETDSSDPPDFVLGSHDSYIEYICFHPSGKILASGSADMTLRFWDVPGRKPISTHRVHDDFVTAIAFNPQGNIVVTGDYSGILKIWDFKMEGL